MLGGPGACSPEKILIKTERSGAIRGIQKYVMTILKMNTFQQQQNLIAIFFSQINVDVHAIQKWSDRELKRGVWGFTPPEAEDFFKKSNKMEAFPLFFFAFWQGSLDPPNYELAPQLP